MDVECPHCGKKARVAGFFFREQGVSGKNENSPILCYGCDRMYVPKRPDQEVPVVNNANF